MNIRFLTPDGITPWLAKAAKSGRVLAPRKEGKSVVFRQWTPEDGAPLLAKATISPKTAVLPPCETLVEYKTVKDENNLADVKLVLNAPVQAKPTLLFACRPCDARGIFALDIPYMNGAFKDPYYTARREALTVISLTCDAPSSTCFCTWVNSGPATPEGSDVLMTAVNGGYLLEAVTEKGNALLESSELPDGADKMDEARKLRTEAALKLIPRKDFSKAPERLKVRFTDTAFWTEVTSKCMSCGACTYMCPTCQCFTITDEGDSGSESGGRRLRSWDYCMSPMFTREASGHNPRPDKGLRMRNRVNHKYWYSTETTPDHRFGCTGCGRCILQCPVSLDIREIVAKAIEE